LCYSRTSIAEGLSGLPAAPLIFWRLVASWNRNTRGAFDMRGSERQGCRSHHRDNTGKRPSTREILTTPRKSVLGCVRNRHSDLASCHMAAFHSDQIRYNLQRSLLLGRCLVADHSLAGDRSSGFDAGKSQQSGRHRRASRDRRC